MVASVNLPARLCLFMLVRMVLILASDLLVRSSVRKCRSGWVGYGRSLCMSGEYSCVASNRSAKLGHVMMPASGVCGVG